MSQYPLDLQRDPDADPDNPQTSGISQFEFVRGVQELGIGGDILLAPFRGVGQAAEEVYNMVDWALQDYLPDAPDALGLGRSKTLAGGLIEGLTQFSTAFIPIYGTMSLGIRGSSKIANLAKSTLAGAATDFAAFDPFEARLSDLLLKFPALEGPVLEWLAAEGNEADGQFKNRMASMFEGAAMGPMFLPFFWSLKALKGIRKAKASGQDPSTALPAIRDEYVEDLEAGRAEGLADDIEVDLVDQIDGDVTRQNEVMDATAPTETRAEPSPDTTVTAEGEIGGPGDTTVIGGPEDTRAIGDETSLPPDEALPPQPEVSGETPGVPEDWGQVPSPDPARGDKPPDAIFNWENWVKKHSQSIKTVIRAEDPETLAELQKLEGLSHQDIKTKVLENNQVLRDLGINPLSDDQIERLAVSGQLEEIAAQQMRLRGMVGDYSVMVDELATEAGGTMGNAHSLVRWHMAQGNSQNLLNITKRNQEKISQLLSAQGATPPSVLDRGQILNTLRASTDEKFVDEYLKKIGGGDLEQGRRIVTAKLKRYQAAVKLGSKESGLKWLADNPTNTQRFIEYWMNGILSGPTTHAVNATSNALNTFFLIGEKVAGGALKMDTDEMKQGLAMFSYIWKQNTESLKAAGAALKTEQDILDPMYRTVEFGATGGVGESKRALQFENPVGNAIGKLINVPSLFLLASDVYFRTLNYRAMAYSSIVEQAFTKGQGADWVEQQFQKLISDGQFYSYQSINQKAYQHAVSLADASPNLTAEARELLIREEVQKFKRSPASGFDPELGALAETALAYARKATWTTSLTDPDRHNFVKFFGAFQKIANDFPLFRLILPFVRTPTNLAAHLLDRTAGAWGELGKIGYNRVRLLVEQDKEMIRILKAGGEAADDLHGRLASGATFMSMGYMAYTNGYLVGGGPADPEVAAVWRAAGNIPYSFKVGDQSFEFRRFDPWAPMFGVMADIGELMSRPELSETDRSIVEGVSSSLMIAISNSIGSRSVLTGLARVSNVFSDPERYAASWIEQSAVTLLPFSGAAGQILKPDVEKEIRSVLDAIRVKYGMTGEGWSETFGEAVEDKFTALGERIKTSNPHPLQPAMSHLDASDITNKDIYTEMATNQKGGGGHGYQPFPKMMAGVPLDQYTNSEGVSAETRANELMGTVVVKGQTLAQTLRKTMNSPDYKRINDEDYAAGQSPKVDMFRYIHRQYKAEAWDQVLDEFPDLQRAVDNMDVIKDYTIQGIDVPQELLESIMR